MEQHHLKLTLPRNNMHKLQLSTMWRYNIGKQPMKRPATYHMSIINGVKLNAKVRSAVSGKSWRIGPNGMEGFLQVISCAVCNLYFQTKTNWMSGNDKLKLENVHIHENSVTNSVQR